MSELALLGIGGAHVDRVGHWYKAGPNGTSNPGKMTERAGGCMINTLRVAQLLGTCPVGLISARGGDGSGMLVADAIEEAGIKDHSAVFIDRATAQYVAIMDAEGDVRAALADMDIYESALPRHLRRAEPRALIGAAAKVIVDANLPSAGVAQVAEVADGQLIALAVSPSKAPRLRNHGTSIDLVFMNRRELAALTGMRTEAPFEDKLSALQALGFDRAVVSDGAEPVAILEDDSVSWVPVTAADQVRDVTGAGDALAGTVAALWPMMTLSDSVRLGVAAAAMTVGVEGPVNTDLTLEQLKAMTTQPPSEETRNE